MIERNPHFDQLTSGYLFPEVAKRRREFAQVHPQAHIISLGIGNTTEPLTPHVVRGLSDAVTKLGTTEGYSGYGDEQGLTALREKIAAVLYMHNGKQLISPDEVFISDGAKCDIGRIQQLFGSHVRVAVQDPAYPVYVDGSIIAGVVQNKEICYLPCTPENAFFPDVTLIPENSLIYFCSPNNPTGAVATKEQLALLIQVAQLKGCIIIFDAAYSAFIRDESLPKSIFEIEGARTCAIEINSFSKPIGFTGVRLGWSIVPNNLCYACGRPVISDWNRIMTTVFNGASNIAQYGGLAALDSVGLKETRELTDYYLENARIIYDALSKDNFVSHGVELYGGHNAPYIWARFPSYKSWDIFDRFLRECHIVTTPGAGFGPSGEHCMRFSSFGHRKDIIEAAQRLMSFVL